VAPTHRARQRLGDVEGGDRFPPAVPGRGGRHRDRGVLGQHRHHGIDVVAFPRVDVALDELARGRVAERAQRCLLALVGEPLVNGPPGALQGALDGCDRGLQRLCNLLRREAEHLAQDQRRALSGRQLLQRRDESELDALAQLVASRGRGITVREA
jgi:hypothetical protein